MYHYACWFFDRTAERYLVYDLKYHHTLVFQTQTELENWAGENEIELENEIAH